MILEGQVEHDFIAPGLLEVTAGEVDDPDAVALQDGLEILVAPTEDLRLGTDEVKSNLAALSRNVLLRDPLLILALALLLLEWAVWCGRR